MGNKIVIITLLVLLNTLSNYGQVSDVIKCVRESNLKLCIEQNELLIPQNKLDLLSIYFDLDRKTVANFKVPNVDINTATDSALFYLIEAGQILKSNGANEELAFLSYKKALSLNVSYEIKSEIYKQICNYLTLASTDTLLVAQYVKKYQSICYDNLDCLWSDFIAQKFVLNKERTAGKNPKYDINAWENLSLSAEKYGYKNLHLDILCSFASYLSYFPDQLDESIAINEKGLKIARSISQECLNQHSFLLNANIANIKMKQGHFENALSDFMSFNNKIINQQKLDNQAIYYNWIAECYSYLNNPDSAVAYIKKANRTEKLSQNSKISRAVRDINEKYQNDELKNDLLKEARKRKTQQIYFATMAFVFLLLLLLSFFILNSYRLKKRVLEESLMRSTAESKLKTLTALSEERTRIAAEMHDDLGGGLTTIKFLSQKLLRKATDDKTKNQVNKIVTQSETLVNNMSEIIWAMNSGFDTLTSLVSYSRRFAYEYLDIHDIDLSFKTDGDTKGYYLSGTERRNIFLVIKEVLHNAVKHAECDKITITFFVSNDLKISVVDNGKGIVDMNELGNGLNNMKLRMQNIGGTANVKSDNGLSILLRIPELNKEI